ncbi:regulator of cytokinesis 1b-like protein [Sarcoptes scabiei]|uniref:Regulator of cytokinesis 1b-like protein n=1 Tax=Sarcoptes scabiei TaxID=52283 RepID=A0A132A2V8_SARSC|nr:regulator of cytokinesis 1b-like protein [Sarcoptes scabiei]
MNRTLESIRFDQSKSESSEYLKLIDSTIDPLSVTTDIVRDNKMIGCLKQLGLVWEKLGQSTSVRSQQTQQLRAKLIEIVERIKIEQKQLLERMFLDRENLREELSRLTEGLRRKSINISQNLSLIEQNKLLREEIESLSRIKNERLMRLNEIRAKMIEVSWEENVCTSLNVDCVTPQLETDIPSEEELENYQKRFEELDAKLAMKKNRFNSLNDSIQKLCKQIDFVPRTESESNLFGADPKKFIYSEKNMFELSNFYIKITQRYNSLYKEMEQSFERLRNLWNRLDIDPIEQQQFQSKLNIIITQPPTSRLWIDNREKKIDR